MLKLKRIVNLRIIQPLSVVTSFKTRLKLFDEIVAKIESQEARTSDEKDFTPILSDIIDHQFTSLVDRVLNGIVFPQGDFQLFYKAAMLRTSEIFQKMVLALEKNETNYKIFLETLKYFGCALVEKSVLELGDISLQIDDIFFILEQIKEVASYADVLDVIIDIHRQVIRLNKLGYLDKIKKCATNNHNKADKSFYDLVFLHDLKENSRLCDKTAFLYYVKNKYKMSFELFSEALLIISRRDNRDNSHSLNYLMKYLLASNLCTPYAFEGVENINLTVVLQECLLLAAWEGDFKKIDLLFELGASPSAVAQIHYTWSKRLETSKNTMASLEMPSLLQIAVLTGDLLLVEKILAKGGDINQNSPKGLSTLHVACAGWKLEGDKLCKPCQYRLNIIHDMESRRTYNFANQMILFSQTNQLSSMNLTMYLVRRLLDMSANVNAVDDQGLTPLHMVILSNMAVDEKLQLAEILLSDHADAMIKDFNNRVPFEYIQQDDLISQEHKLKFSHIFHHYSHAYTQFKP